VTTVAVDTTGSGAPGRSDAEAADPGLWPRRYRRSDVYRKLVALDRRLGLTDALNQAGSAGREAVIQDVEIPVGAPRISSPSSRTRLV